MKTKKTERRRQAMRTQIEAMAQRSVNLNGLDVSFYRTTRVPAGKLNSLPAGLGTFPIYKVEDFKSGVPKDWQREGVFFPMYKSEAMWMGFSRGYRNPSALIVAAGNINAISGKPFDLRSNKFDKSRKKRKSGFDIRLEEKQNYLVVPPQPWIDGWKAEDGKVYQFVAAEMGSGETVEGQITGKEKFGGIQLILYKPKEGVKLTPETRPNEYVQGGIYKSFGGCFGGGMDEMGSAYLDSSLESAFLCSTSGPSRNMNKRLTRSMSANVQSMGLGRGGEISQKIYPDPYGLEVWNPNPTSLTRIYLVSSQDFRQITGHDAPPTPVTYDKYQELGMPWFDLYDEKYKDSEGSSVFDKLKQVSGGPLLVQDNSKQNKIDKSKFDIFK